jgi:hypothetical protein
MKQGWIMIFYELGQHLYFSPTAALLAQPVASAAGVGDPCLFLKRHYPAPTSKLD